MCGEIDCRDGIPRAMQKGAYTSLQQAVEETAAFVRPLLSKMQSYKSSFSASIVENDDRIQKVGFFTLCYSLCNLFPSL